MGLAVGHKILLAAFFSMNLKLENLSAHRNRGSHGACCATRSKWLLGAAGYTALHMQVPEEIMFATRAQVDTLQGSNV